MDIPELQAILGSKIFEIDEYRRTVRNGDGPIDQYKDGRRDAYVEIQNLLKEKPVVLQQPKIRIHQDPSYCPKCLQKAVRVCKCGIGDSSCENGHEWHVCRVHNKIVMGKGDHSKPMTACQCC
jgi:hypothetical protein